MHGPIRFIRSVPRRNHSALFHRLPVSFILAGIVGGCSLSVLDLDRCWSPNDLKQGARFKGTVLIMAGMDIQPLMSPVACEGINVIANISEDSLGYVPSKEKDPTEPVFYRADVKGVVDGTIGGRPAVTILEIDHVGRTKPKWWKTG